MGGERESVRWKGYGLSCRLISLKLRDIDKRLRYIYLYVYINIYRYKYIYIYLTVDEAASGESHRSMGILNNCLSSYG